jgi:hypothetical protein
MATMAVMVMGDGRGSSDARAASGQASARVVVVSCEMRRARVCVRACVECARRATRAIKPHTTQGGRSVTIAPAKELPNTSAAAGERPPT